MSNDTLTFSNIMLSQTGKRGVLKELDGGYYEIMLGAFGTVGSGGWFYDVESAMNYFKNDKEFMYFLNSGRLRGEWGHPVRPPGMSDQDWFVRIHTMYEPNVACHIRKIRFSTNEVRDARGRAVVAVIGEVRPSGKNSAEFKDQLENPHEDVNFSIRSFAKRDFRNMTKHLTKVITWDPVFDPGVKVASKYTTPSLESSLGDRIDFENPASVALALDECEFSAESLRSSVYTGSEDLSFESENEYIAVIDRLVEANSSSVSRFVGTNNKFLSL